MRISIIQCYNYLCTKKVKSVNSYLIHLYAIEGFKIINISLLTFDINRKPKKSFLSGIERKWYLSIRQMCINKFQQESIKKDFQTLKYSKRCNELKLYFQEYFFCDTYYGRCLLEFLQILNSHYINQLDCETKHYTTSIQNSF